MEISKPSNVGGDSIDCGKPSSPGKKNEEEGGRSGDARDSPGPQEEEDANSAPTSDRGEGGADDGKPQSSTKRKRPSQNRPRTSGGGSRETEIDEDDSDIKVPAGRNERAGDPSAGTMGGASIQTQSPLFHQRASSTSSVKRGASPEPTPEDLARMSRSERKRHREKKRRSDVNKGFDDLMALLVQIDPSIKADAEDRARKNQGKGQRGSGDVDSSVLINRVELISRAVTVMERIHRENEERKMLIAELTNRLGDGTGHVPDDQVTMMVPTLTPVDSIMQAAASRGGLGMTPQYSLLPSSMAQVRMAQQAASFPQGHFMGFGSHGLMQSIQPGGMQASGGSSASGMLRSQQVDRSSDESPSAKRPREFGGGRRW